jgi:hypothetical protein
MNPCIKPVTGMSLSNAMESGFRWGINREKHKYQAWTKEWSPETRGIEVKLAGACPIGVACYVAAPSCEIDRRDQAIKLFPQLLEYVPRHKFPFPVQDIKVVSLGDLITYYNDRTELTTEEIVEAVRRLGY